MGGSREIRLDLIRVVGPVLLVLVERSCPGHFLGSWIDVHRADQAADGAEQVTGDLAHRPVGPEGDVVGPSVAVLGDHLVTMKVQRNHECP